MCQLTQAQSPASVWAKNLGEADIRNSGVINATSVAVDSVSGAVYTTGTFTGTIDFDPGDNTFPITSTGTQDIFISKLDSNGNFVWAKAIHTGSGYYCIATSIALDDSGNVYTTGGFSGTVDFDPGIGSMIVYSWSDFDIFILKLNSSGDFLWVNDIGGILAYCWATSICIDPVSRDIFITGIISGIVDFGGNTLGNLNGGYNIFISRYKASGNLVWAKGIEGDSYWFTMGTSIIVDPLTGSVYTTGQFYGTSDFDPGGGVFNLTSNGGADIFISKLDSIGNFVWAKTFGGANEDTGRYISFDTTGVGYVYTTGRFENTVDFDPGPGVFNLSGPASFILKLDSEANLIWAKQLSVSINALKIDNAYNVLLTGAFGGTFDFDPGVDTFNLTSNGQSDIFISKLDSTGNFVWAKAIGGTSWDTGTSLAIDENDHVHVTGDFNSPFISFDGINLNNINDNDIFITKLDVCSNIVTSTADSGLGSLRDVIACASDNAIITFSLPPISQITLMTGEIVISKNLTLSGPGASNLTVSGNNTSRIFNLLSGKNFTIKNLSLKNATAVTNGGAIFVKGNLTLNNAVLQNNFQNGIHRCMTLINPGSLTIIGNVDIKN
ncbi:MAG: hypothetical protein WBP41_13480 [Saprospiraceae bacterium]